MDPTGDKPGGSSRIRGPKALESLQAGLRVRLDALVEENKRLKHSVGQAHDLLASLSRIGEFSDLTALCEHAVGLLVALFDLRGAAISVREGLDAPRLSLTRYRGWKEIGPDELVFETGSPLIGALQEARKPVAVADLVGHLGPRAKERFILRRLECEIIAPLAVGDRVLGILLLTRHTNGTTLSREHLEHVARSASVLAVGIENLLLRKPHSST